MPDQNAETIPTIANQTNVFLILSACKNLDEARRIAKALVDEHLASCVNIVGVDSIYEWKGRIVESEEHLVIAKTHSSAYERLERRIRDLHSYELPEILGLKVEKGNAPYLDWIFRNVCTAQGD